MLLVVCLCLVVMSRDQDVTQLSPKDYWVGTQRDPASLQGAARGLMLVCVCIEGERK